MLKETSFKKVFTALIFIGSIVTPLAPSHAHEGHNHGNSKALKAPKGGMIKSLEEVYVEVVPKGNDLKIYFYDHDYNPKPIKDFKVMAKIELPRKKQNEDLPLKAQETFYEASFDAKGAHRYTINLFITDPSTKHEDVLKFTVEPKK